MRRELLLEELKAFPDALRECVRSMNEWDVPLTHGGWTAAQIVHHLADVHSVGLARVRMTLTESVPSVRPYRHEEWAALRDATDPSLVWASLAMLDGTHARWAALLDGLDAESWKRCYHHPEHGRLVTIEQDLAWHVEHGRAHLLRLH